MKAFLLGVAVAIVLAVGGYFAIDQLQETSYEAFSTSGVRL